MPNATLVVECFGGSSDGRMIATPLVSLGLLQWIAAGPWEQTGGSRYRLVVRNGCLAWVNIPTVPSDREATT